MGGSEAPICFDEEDVLSMLADFIAKFDNVVIVANIANIANIDNIDNVVIVIIITKTTTTVSTILIFTITRCC